MEKQFERELVNNIIKLTKPIEEQLANEEGLSPDFSILHKILPENIINFSIKASEYCQSISEIPSEYIDEDFEELRCNVVKSMCDLQFNILNKIFKNKEKQN